MIGLKKFYGDELLRLALVLSLLKANPEDFLERETQQLLAGHISNGSDWSSEQEARTLIRPRFVHPKSLDNILINYERQLFEELNSLGRYGNNYIDYNDRIWNNRGPILHTYLVNNVATDTVAPALATQTVTDDNDGVSADENVAQEVKVEDDQTSQDSAANQTDNAVGEAANDSDTEVPDGLGTVDAVVTLSPGFLSNHTEDFFSEIATRSFDVEDFLIQPDMQIKKEQDTELDVRIKKEDGDDFFSDNAIDNFVPYFAEKSDIFEKKSDSVVDQNIADLRDYDEMFEIKDQIRTEFDLDLKQENLEQYLLENTPLEAEACELELMFEEELVLDIKRERASTSFTTDTSGVSEMDIASEASDVKLEPDEGHHTGDELTQEDMDLIEVLWKQDVDMGFCLQDPLQPDGPQATKVNDAEIKADKGSITTDEKIDKKAESEKIEEVKKTLLDDEVKEDDPWAGLSYTVDTETGEYVLQGELPRELVTSEDTRFDLLEEALHLVDLDDETEPKDEQPQPEKVEEGRAKSGGGEMLHPAMRHVPHHPLAHYHNQSLMRSMSVEQRWQDLASLLTIPPPPDQYQHHYHHQHPHNISAHGAPGGYAPNYHAAIPPVPEKHPEVYGAAAPIEGAYKVESAHHPPQHDGMYYHQNSSTEVPPTNSDGFLQSILNDEDLQLMDMAMNEGMYTMRMLEGTSGHHPQHPNHTTHMMMAERDSASDSAVSSMGSERVPSLSDSEWCDGNDSAQEYHSSKFRPYESAGYPRERAAPLQPQKKHHMFGKRCFQEQNQPTLDPLVPPPPRNSVVKYECPEQTYHHDSMHMHNEFARQQTAPPHVPLQPALDLNVPHSTHTLLQGGVSSPISGRYPFGTPERVRHNHTYSAPPAPHGPHVPPTHPDHRPPAARDKRVRRLTDGSVSDGGSSVSGQHLSRDEKRAKALGIPLEVHDIINLPMDEFNERLSKHDLSEAQLSLIRDIRRRGKNKVAAQNCRKRKLDQITSLADEVRTMRDRKARTQRDHHALNAERQRVKERFAALYRHVFQNLRDADGRPLSSNQYSLQQAADGNVVLIPKMSQHSDHQMNRTSDDEIDRKTKFDQ